MCGRYSLAPDEFSEIKIISKVELPVELHARYNIAHVDGGPNPRRLLV